MIIFVYYLNISGNTELALTQVSTIEAMSLSYPSGYIGRTRLCRRGEGGWGAPIVSNSMTLVKCTVLTYRNYYI